MCTHPIDPMGIHMLHCAHGHEHIRNSWCSLWHLCWHRVRFWFSCGTKVITYISFNHIQFLSSTNRYCVHQKCICTLVDVDALPSPKLGPRWALVFKTSKLWGLEGTLPAFSIKRGRRACWSSGMGLGRRTRFSYLLEPTSSQPTSWLIRILEHPWG